MTEGNGRGKNGRNAKGQFTSAHVNVWKPGQSGNPTGAVPRNTITDWLHEIGSEFVKDNNVVARDEAGEPITKLQRLARYLYKEALRGNTAAMTAILDRVDPASKHGAIVGGSIINITIEKGEAPPQFVESHDVAPPELEAGDGST